MLMISVMHALASGNALNGIIQFRQGDFQVKKLGSCEGELKAGQKFSLTIKYTDGTRYIYHADKSLSTAARDALKTRHILPDVHWTHLEKLPNGKEDMTPALPYARDAIAEVHIDTDGYKASRESDFGLALEQSRYRV
jgi:hypothetical protein